ncbi:MAG TPA: TMEM175 family protein [Mycobacteriales bacterium]|nr:TMEM175 family protein [Mycobacteriales bacterium]
MRELATEPERTRDFERFLTFLDAIAAIAITLLVLPLVDLAGDFDEAGSVWQLLQDHWARIGAFFLSFLVIARLWSVQHTILHHVVTTSAVLTRLLLWWSLTIVVLPFPTALVATSGASHQAATKILYVGTVAVSSFVLSVLSLVIARTDELRDSADTPDVGRSFATSVTFVLALAVMLLAPVTSYWPLLLILVSERAWETIRSFLRRG